MKTQQQIGCGWVHNSFVPSLPPQLLLLANEIAKMTTAVAEDWERG